MKSFQPLFLEDNCETSFDVENITLENGLNDSYLTSLNIQKYLIDSGYSQVLAVKSKLEKIEGISQSNSYAYIIANNSNGNKSFYLSSPHGVRFLNIFKNVEIKLDKTIFDNRLFDIHYFPALKKLLAEDLYSKEFNVNTRYLADIQYIKAQPRLEPMNQVNWQKQLWMLYFSNNQHPQILNWISLDLNIPPDQIRTILNFSNVDFTIPYDYLSSVITEILINHITNTYDVTNTELDL